MGTFVLELMVGISLHFLRISVTAEISAENNFEYLLELRRLEWQATLFNVYNILIWT